MQTSRSEIIFRFRWFNAKRRPWNQRDDFPKIPGIFTSEISFRCLVVQTLPRSSLLRFVYNYFSFSNYHYLDCVRCHFPRSCLIKILYSDCLPNAKIPNLLSPIFSLLTALPSLFSAFFLFFFFLFLFVQTTFSSFLISSNFFSPNYFNCFASFVLFYFILAILTSCLFPSPPPFFWLLIFPNLFFSFNNLLTVKYFIIAKVACTLSILFFFLSFIAVVNLIRQKKEAIYLK